MITMQDRDTEDDRERRLRRAAIIAAQHQVPPDVDQPDGTTAGRPDAEQADDGDERGDDAARARMEQKALWVDLQITQAMERGDPDDLPGAGKPIRGLGATHDPDWWVKGLIERERITGVLPPALALRKEDAELDALLDRQTAEKEVRRVVADFNRRVVDARRQLQGGPPVVTATRDEEQEVAAWLARREERRRAQQEQLDAARQERSQSRWGGLWRRRR